MGGPTAVWVMEDQDTSKLQAFSVWGEVRSLGSDERGGRLSPLERILRSFGGHLCAVDGQKPEQFLLFPGQLRFWNPDDLNASPGASLPTPDWIEEKLQEVCEHLGITRDGHLNRKKLVSIFEQYGLQTAAGEVSGHLWTPSPGCVLVWPPVWVTSSLNHECWLTGPYLGGGFQLQLVAFQQVC